MTNHEAANVLEVLKEKLSKSEAEALRMAIEALKILPSACKYRRTYPEIEGYFKKRDVCYNKKNAAECNGDYPLLKCTKK